MDKIYKFIIVVLLALLSTSNVYSQKITPFKVWSGKELAKANSGRRLKSISFQEKKVIFFINLVRMNGQLFVDTYLKDYMEDVRIPKNKYYRSLIKTLKEQTALPPLQPKDDLIKEAIKHAKEMGRVGKKGHRSADHKNFVERMKPFKLKYDKVREANQYGYPDALSIVIDLLIDDNQESLIHRKHILDPRAYYIGVGVRAHKKYQTNTTILFASEVNTK